MDNQNYSYYAVYSEQIKIFELQKGRDSKGKDKMCDCTVYILFSTIKIQLCDNVYYTKQ